MSSRLNKIDFKKLNWKNLGDSNHLLDQKINLEIEKIRQKHENKVKYLQIEAEEKYRCSLCQTSNQEDKDLTPWLSVDSSGNTLSTTSKVNKANFLKIKHKLPPVSSVLSPILTPKNMSRSSSRSKTNSIEFDPETFESAIDNLYKSYRRKTIDSREYLKSLSQFNKSLGQVPLGQ